MPLNLSQILKQIRTFLAGLSSGQRKMLAAGAAAAAVCTAAFVMMMGRGDYKTLYTGLTRDEATSLAHHLAEDNIPAQLSSDGTGILVPQDKLDKARLDMASQGLPQSGRMGFEIFDKPNWAGSDFSEQVNYQRALEGELERTTYLSVMWRPSACTWCYPIIHFLRIRKDPPRPRFWSSCGARSSPKNL